MGVFFGLSSNTVATSLDFIVIEPSGVTPTKITTPANFRYPSWVGKMTYKTFGAGVSYQSMMPFRPVHVRKKPDICLICGKAPVSRFRGSFGNSINLVSGTNSVKFQRFRRLMGARAAALPGDFVGFAFYSLLFPQLFQPAQILDGFQRLFLAENPLNLDLMKDTLTPEHSPPVVKVPPIHFAPALSQTGPCGPQPNFISGLPSIHARGLTSG